VLNFIKKSYNAVINNTLKIKKKVQHHGLPANFDPNEYVINNPSIKNTDLNPVEHYLSETSKKNGLHHDSKLEIQYKQSEGPEKLPANFEPNEYVANNPNIYTTNLNPVEYFLTIGYKDINPLHQTISTNNNQYLDFEKKIIFSLDIQNNNNLANRRKNKIALSKSAYIIEKITSEIKKLNQKELIITISHDSYINNTGGVQTCMINEQVYANNLQIAYLSFYPEKPLLKLVNDKIIYGINFNGISLGLADTKYFKKIIKDLSIKFKSYLVIHTLHGHNIETLDKIIGASRFNHIYLWVHDYFLMCEGYNLFRNNVEYCGAPSVESSACEICIYGNDRQGHIKKINSIIEKAETIISPSTAATKIFLSYMPQLKDKTITHPHYEILDYKISSMKAEKIRVGYIGYGLFFKGYFDFVEVANQFEGNEAFEFIKFSSDQIKTNNIKNITAAVTKDDSRAMVNALEKNRIDILLMPSKWPETFNLVTYEALLSKIPVLVIGNHGNPRNIIKKTGLGWVCDSVKEAMSILSDIANSKILVIDEINILQSSLTIDFIKEDNE